jgi:carboxymethylenebutenolidase
MSSLDWPGAIKDIEECAAFLRSKGCKKVGVVGFCMGGALTLASCIRAPQSVDAGVCFYGIPPKQFADPANLKVPIQFHFGDLDHAKGFSDKTAADALKKTLLENGQDVSEFYQYPDGI